MGRDLAQPTVVVADLHLTRRTPAAVIADFARLLQRHGAARVIVAGDFFDLGIDRPDGSRARAASEVMLAHPPLCRAMRDHLAGGGELWFAAGNHDPDIAEAPLREALLRTIAPPAAAGQRIRTSPWFFRLDGLHVEHGHLYDPDNAPAHPLVVGTRSLGSHFSVEFLRHTGALDYLLTNDAMPGQLFLSAFQLYGWRGPYVVFRYFYAAFLALAQSGPWYRGRDEVALGRQLHRSFAAEAAVAEPWVDRLVDLGAQPTLRSFWGTFARLYLDRVLATVSMAGGLSAVALGRRRAGALSALAGAALMGGSWLSGRDRYRGGVMARLAAAAERVADATAAQLVVFGHTHRECAGPRYSNTGSFAHPRQPAEQGRPYLEIEADGTTLRAVRRRITAP